MVIVYAQNGDVAAFSLAQEDAARRYPGERVGGRNPQFYEAATAAPVRDAVAVYVGRFWARIIEDYGGFGIPVHVLEELTEPAAAFPEERGFEYRAPAEVPPEPQLKRGPGRPRLLRTADG